MRGYRNDRINAYIIDVYEVSLSLFNDADSVAFLYFLMNVTGYFKNKTTALNDFENKLMSTLLIILDSTNVNASSENVISATEHSLSNLDGRFLNPVDAALKRLLENNKVLKRIWEDVKK